ncbi:MAG TPA: M3 family metallopeptidase [Longimicrobiaceae bacterium]|nr:M3 family metallopeptidase [Longimicrobiaceae bacterium]
MTDDEAMNPLLSEGLPIPFHRIRAEHVVPAVREALAAAEREVEAIVAEPGERTWDNTLGRLDAMEERLDHVTHPVSHLLAVMNTPELREAYQEVLPELAAFYARLPLNAGLWAAVRELAASPEAAALTGVRRRHLDKTVREFERAGADLPPEAKARVEAVRVELSRLQTEFSNHVLDATNAFEMVVTDPDDLRGLPPSAVAQARAAAEARGVEGWRFTLHLPSYQPFMEYAENRALRERMYRAYTSRASAEPHDNRPLIARILELRRELAALLGYRDFADYRLEDSMARSGERALDFEEDLTARTRPYWEREMEALAEFAREELGIPELEPWDTLFASERMRRARYDLDQEELRPYFPLEGVLGGLFEVARRLFGVRVTEREVPEVWHPEVRFYDVHDEEGKLLGGFYADWFPRETKRQGAWMSGLVTGGPTEEGWMPHLASLAGNVSPPEGGRPALLTHNEVQTVFHEFGHLLHHVLSRVEVRARGGTSVARDWVELPSQIMENWTWEREALDLFARHWETGEPIPEPLYRKMLAARNHMAATFQMRQLSYGTMDLSLHARYEPARDGDAVAYAQEVLGRFAYRPDFARNHFVAGFTHVFAGGYAAAYYSYLWAEVLDSDAFSRFQREGLFNRETGRAFVEAVLSRGDAADPGELFRDFMGRDPDPAALLRRNLGEGGPGHHEGAAGEAPPAA